MSASEQQLVAAAAAAASAIRSLHKANASPSADASSLPLENGSSSSTSAASSAASSSSSSRKRGAAEALPHDPVKRSKPGLGRVQDVPEEEDVDEGVEPISHHDPTHLDDEHELHRQRMLEHHLPEHPFVHLHHPHHHIMHTPPHPHDPLSHHVFHHSHAHAHSPPYDDEEEDDEQVDVAAVAVAAAAAAAAAINKSSKPSPRPDVPQSTLTKPLVERLRELKKKKVGRRVISPPKPKPVPASSSADSRFVPVRGTPQQTAQRASKLHSYLLSHCKQDRDLMARVMIAVRRRRGLAHVAINLREVVPPPSPPAAAAARSASSSSSSSAATTTSPSPSSSSAAAAEPILSEEPKPRPTPSQIRIVESVLGSTRSRKRMHETRANEVEQTLLAGMRESMQYVSSLPADTEKQRLLVKQAREVVALAVVPPDPSMCEMVAEEIGLPVALIRRAHAQRYSHTGLARPLEDWFSNNFASEYVSLSSRPSQSRRKS